MDDRERAGSAPRSGWRSLGRRASFTWTLNLIMTITVASVIALVTALFGRTVLWVEEATGVVLVAALSVSLIVANRLLVVRPLRRMRRGIRLMAAGYPDALVGSWEAREWQDIAEDIRVLHQELSDTVRDLVEAERTGLSALAERGERDVETELSGVVPTGTRTVTPGLARDLALMHLRNKARLLETGDPSDPAIRSLAQEVWEHDIHELERWDEIPLRSRLDDAALRILDPEAYEEITAYLRSLAAAPTRWVRQREEEIRQALAARDVEALRVASRTKHAAGVWRKARRLGLPAQQLSDLFGFRVIVENEALCYRALHALHEAFEPLPLQFKDYIKRPKPNGYQSLHTHLRTPDGAVFEVQIRSTAMHDRAERGEAAHWKYKRLQDRALEQSKVARAAAVPALLTAEAAPQAPPSPV